jgi:hypothetical protein
MLSIGTTTTFSHSTDDAGSMTWSLEVISEVHQPLLMVIWHDDNPECYQTVENCLQRDPIVSWCTPKRLATTASTGTRLQHPNNSNVFIFAYS